MQRYRYKVYAAIWGVLAILIVATGACDYTEPAPLVRPVRPWPYRFSVESEFFF